MEWAQVVDYLCTRVGKSLREEDLSELSASLSVPPLSPSKLRGGGEAPLREILNTYYYYVSKGQNGPAIEAMVEKMSRISRFEGLASELKATYLTNLRIKQQIHITPFKKFEPTQVLGKKTSGGAGSIENNEISLLRNEVAELRQKMAESFNGHTKVPSSPKPPMRRKASSTPEKSPVSSSTESSRLDQMNKILLDHEVCISEQKKTLAKMTKLCFGALSAVEKIEAKLFESSNLGGHRESNIISLWENSHKQLKKELIETKNELRSVSERVKGGSTSHLGHSPGDEVKQLRSQTNLLSEKLLFTNQNVESFSSQLSSIQDQLNHCTKTIHKGSSKGSETESQRDSDKNEENIRKLQASLGTLLSNELPGLRTQIKDVETGMGRRVSNAEHVVRIDALRKDFTRKYDNLKSDLLKGLKSCEDVFEDKIKVLSGQIQDITKRTSACNEKERLEGLVATTKTESQDIRIKMDKLLSDDGDNKSCISNLNQKSSLLEEEVKQLSELMSKKLCELDSLQKEVDKKVEARDVEELKTKIFSALGDIKDFKASRDQLTFDLNEAKLSYSEESHKNTKSLSRLQESLDGSIEQQKKMESELSFCRNEVADRVKSNIESCTQVLKNEIDNCWRELSNCKSNVSSLGKDISDHIESQGSQLSSSIEPVKKEMLSVKKDLSSCREDMSNYGSRLDKFNKDTSLSILRVRDNSDALGKKLSKEFEGSLDSTSLRLQKLIEDIRATTELKMQEQKKDLHQDLTQGLMPKEEVQAMEKSLNNVISSVSEQIGAMKTDFEDLKLSEKSKYTLLDKKLKDFSVFSEEINSSVCKVEEELKDLRLDVSVDSKLMNHVKSTIDELQRSQSVLNSLSQEMESVSETGSELKTNIKEITDNVRKINNDFLQFKSFMQSSSNEVKTLENNSNNEIMCVKKKIDDLVTSKELRDRLIENVETIDKRDKNMEEFEKKISQKLDENIVSLENDMEATRQKLCLSENSIESLDKRIGSLLRNEIKSRESLEPLINDVKGTFESNLGDVIQHVMKNQNIIGTIMDMIEDADEEEDE